MCYSAQIERDWRKYLRVMGPDAALNLDDFIKKYWRRPGEFHLMKIPKAVDAWFANPQNGDEQKIAAFIEDFNDREATKLQQELFKQKKRQADAERVLEKKETKKALEDKRISTDKIAWALGKLNDLKRTEINDRDSCIFPGYFAPSVHPASTVNFHRRASPLRAFRRRDSPNCAESPLPCQKPFPSFDAK